MKAGDHSGHRRKFALGILAEPRHRGHRLVLALLSASRPGLAERAARALLRLRPSDDTLLHVVAALGWARGDTAAAAEAAGKALAIDPSVARHRWLLASIRQSGGERERALAILGPERPGREPLRNLCLRASLHIQRGDHTTAARLARIAHDRFPRKPEPLRLLISASIESGDFVSASAFADLAGRTCPENAGLLHLRATVSERLGDIEGAQRALERCLELRPDMLPARLALVRVLTLQGKVAAAQRLARAAAQDATALVSAERHLAATILTMAQLEPPSELVAAIACQPCTHSDEALWALWASISHEDRTGLLRAYEAALRLVERDGRLLGLLSGIGETIDADALNRGLTPPSLLVAKLKAQALSEAAQDPALADADRLAGNLLRQAAAQDQDEPAVSFICPIHRPQDVPNLLAQLGGQIWQRAEVIFCINGEGIDASDLALQPEKAFRVRHLVLPAGRSLGHYLNRAIAEATGDIIIRIDADDIYDPDYTRVMVRFLRNTGADIASINPYCFYFEDLDQTYLIRSPGSPVTRDVATGNRQAAGSGSSVCARRDVFARIAFDEDLALGEDVTFYRRALVAGFRVCTLPGHFHTAKRSADKTAHTWRPDDARLLSRESRFLGDGCIVMRPGAQASAAARDAFSDLLSDTAFAPFRELRAEDALRSVRQPLHILRGPDTPLPDRNTPQLIVGDPGAPAPARGAMALALAPENPALEEAIARRHGALSFTMDVLPRLACGDREAFARLGGIARGDRQSFVRRFDAAGLRFAILTNPRCGSEHLCALLASLGLGAPREHVRTPVAALVGRDPKPDAFLRTLFGQIERDGIVGTKLVTQFLFDGDAGPAAERLLAWMVDAGFRFVRLTRTPTESAVSAYVAEQRGVWHVREREHAAFGTSALPDDEGPPLPPYDFEGIAREMARQLDWTRRLDALCEGLIPPGRWIGVDYADILRDAQATVAQISDFLGFAPPPGAVATSPLVAASRGAAQTRAFRTRFTAEWASAATPDPHRAETMAGG